MLPSQLQAALDSKRHGDLDLWMLTLQQLPEVQASSYDLNASAIRVGTSDDISAADKTHLTESLQIFHPWRKGPFDLFGVHIDTEWRSDLKWDRLSGMIEPLAGRRVLDIGCGSGYLHRITTYIRSRIRILSNLLNTRTHLLRACCYVSHI